MTKRPNFLFLITDQHRADWLGCYGHPVVRTPNIDRIAARGARFDRFFAASPVCMPNRASLLTGRYPTTHGLRYNGCLLPTRANTFVDVLRAGGYATASIGKSHLQPFTDNPPFGRRETPAGPIPEAWKPDGDDYGQEEPGRYDAEGRYHFRTPYYGYDHVDMVTSHGDRAGGHYHQWFRENAPDWRALHDPANELPHNYSCPQAYRTPVPEELYPTAYVRDRACEWLRGRAGDDTPFFAFVSFPDPHHPFNPPGRYWDMYHPDQFEVALPYSAHHNPPPPLRHLHDLRARGEMPKVKQAAFMASDQEVREAMALTAGMVAMVDDAVGAVLDALAAAGLAEDTVVVFTSDHGDYLGDYNLLLKGALPSRAISRVPFLWADPAGPKGGAVDALASTVDIAPTILARAGLVGYNGIQGCDLAPALEGGGVRDRLLVEYNDSGARMGFARPARVRSLQTDRWRLTLYAGEDWGELYDLADDPGETWNRWDDPSCADVRAELTEALAHEVTFLMDESPLSQRLA